MRRLGFVWELSGSVYDNYCPACKKEYTVDFVKQAKSVPLCDDCKSPVRPNIRLHSEKVRNDLYTQATSACQKADMILVLGTDRSEFEESYFSDAQLQWLDESLAAEGGKPVFVRAQGDTTLDAGKAFFSITEGDDHARQSTLHLYGADGTERSGFTLVIR